MSAERVLAEFKTNVGQCNSLIANAHQVGPGGVPLLPVIDQQQITVASFLNMFIAWEGFLEAILAEFMTGERTMGGSTPVRYVMPRTLADARLLVIGVMRYFDYANHEHFRRTVKLYFENGYPFEPHISAIVSDLADLRTMRNASAHISSTTQTALEGLALRIFGQPRPQVSLYDMLVSVDPRSQTNETVFVSYQTKLLVAADLMANG